MESLTESQEHRTNGGNQKKKREENEMSNTGSRSPTGTNYQMELHTAIPVSVARQQAMLYKCRKRHAIYYLSCTRILSEK